MQSDTNPVDVQVPFPHGNGAYIDETGKYRYSLWRTLKDVPREEHKTLLFNLLNPSTADGRTDDPTVRRCIGFARNLGYTRVWIGNVFGYRATDPKELRRVPNPVGPMNHASLKTMILQADLIICGWGVHARTREREDIQVVKLIRECGKKPYVFGLTRDGYPKHPLYLAGSARPFEWKAYDGHR